MFVVDTNVLLYAANTDAAEHGRCRDLLESWRGRSTVWYTTWAILMREHGVRRIYTRDADFHRFPFVEVLDPLAP